MDSELAHWAVGLYGTLGCCGAVYGTLRCWWRRQGLLPHTHVSRCGKVCWCSKVDATHVPLQAVAVVTGHTTG